MTVNFVVHNKQPLATKFTAEGCLFNYKLITKPSDEWYQVVFFEAYNSVADPKHFAEHNISRRFSDISHAIAYITRNLANITDA